MKKGEKSACSAYWEMGVCPVLKGYFCQSVISHIHELFFQLRSAEKIKAQCRVKLVGDQRGFLVNDIKEKQYLMF